MIRQYISVIIVLLVAIQAKAQFTPVDKELALQVSECILGVALVEEDNETIEYLANKKPDELNKYRSEIAQFNKYLEEAIQREWNISKDVRILTSTQIKDIEERRDPTYCIMKMSKRADYIMNVNPIAKNPALKNVPGYVGNYDHRSSSYTMEDGTFALQLIWGGEPKKEIAFSYIPEIGLPRVGVNFMVQHLRNQIVDCIKQDIARIGDLKKAAKIRSKDISKKTALLYDQIIGKPLRKQIEKGKLDKYYQYPLEIVDSSKVENIAINHTQGFIYPMIIPAGAESGAKELYNYLFVDSADGRIVTLTGMSGGENGAINTYHIYQLRKGAK
uniref:Uncharacterized protein n=1 Tax=Roseihalotalea indica TaxID=2867963 RepID=A0AA49JJJ4_9BACT|nr:hypothetical protein K4G66_13995 [Tunicatimonas sp. TK19036]